MGPGYKREDLQANAQAKLNDAITLFENKRYSNAYYLTGYSVEIGLKACIAAQISAETIPEKEFIKRFLDHNFMNLIGLAGLAIELKEQQDRDDAFSANWAVASEWQPDSRYEPWNAGAAQLIISAVADLDSGVLPWIKTHW